MGDATVDPHMDGGFVSERSKAGYPSYGEKSINAERKAIKLGDVIEYVIYYRYINTNPTSESPYYWRCRGCKSNISGEDLLTHAEGFHNAKAFEVVDKFETTVARPGTKERYTKETDSNKRAVILQEAEKLINGDRADTYGSPQESFGRIADLWNAMGFRMDTSRMIEGSSRAVNATDVALALTQLKVSRIISSPDHEDSWIDAAGYIALGAEIELN